jgi:predicted ester cyclase
MERAHYTADEQRVLGLARRILDEVFHKGDVNRIDDLVADSGTLRHPVPGMAHDRAGFSQMVSEFHAAFPGFDLIIENNIVKGGVAVIRCTLQGAHAGPWLGVPASGKGIAVAALAYCDCGDEAPVDRVREWWLHFDALSLLHQVGGLPLIG